MQSRGEQHSDVEAQPSPSPQHPVHVPHVPHWQVLMHVLDWLPQPAQSRLSLLPGEQTPSPLHVLHDPHRQLPSQARL
jgi:hypothetical protein